MDNKWKYYINKSYYYNYNNLFSALFTYYKTTSYSIIQVAKEVGGGGGGGAFEG